MKTHETEGPHWQPSGFLQLAVGAAALPALSRIAGARNLPDAAGADHRRPFRPGGPYDIHVRSWSMAI